MLKSGEKLPNITEVESGQSKGNIKKSVKARSGVSQSVVLWTSGSETPKEVYYQADFSALPRLTLLESLIGMVKEATSVSLPRFISGSYFCCCGCLFFTAP